MTASSPGFPNGSEPPAGCAAAHIALERATHAESRAASAESGYRVMSGAVAELVSEVKGLRKEVRVMASRLGLVERKADGVEDEIEDTKVRNLRAALKKAEAHAEAIEAARVKESTWWKRRFVGVGFAVLTALAIAAAFAALGVHR